MRIGISLTGNRRAGWSPSNLLKNNSWLDYLDISDLTKMWQDTDGAVAVTAPDDPVRRIDGQRGLTSWRAPSDAARPIYKRGSSRGLKLTPTHWVDANAGNDSNNGLTEATAWATLGMVNGITIASGQTVVVRIKAGVYDAATDNFFVSLASQTGVTFYAVFEPGCTLDGTNFTLGTQNGVGFRSEATGGGGNRFYAYGNGCVIQNVTTADGNGLDGSGDAAEAHFYDFDITNCRDGISMHQDIEGYFYGVSARDCLKWAVSHVGDGPTFHYNCTFADENNTATLGGLAAITSTGGGIYEDCVFLPGTNFASGLVDCKFGPAVFTRCQLGTTSRRVELGPFSGGAVVATDCYINAMWEGLYGPLTLSRSYGKFTARVGVNTGGPLTMNNCILSGPATDRSAIFLSEYNPGSSSAFYVQDNIFETSTAAAFMSLDATNAEHLAAAGSFWRNNILSGSAAFDADLSAALLSGNVTADALIGAADTLNPADYGYASGSPAIGAAINGGNCGFSDADATSLVMRTYTPPFIHWLSFNGSSMSMATSAAIDFGSKNRVQIFAGVRKTSDSSIGTVLEASTDSASTIGAFGLFYPWVAPDYRAYSTGFSASFANATGGAAPETSTLAVVASIPEDILELRRNGSQTASSSADQLSGNYGTHTLFLGARNSEFFRFSGNVYSLLLRASTDTLTATDIANAEQWTNQRNGRPIV